MNTDIRPFTIGDCEPLVNALKRLNSVHSRAMTLFAVDEHNRMNGTLTDGDIRRGLIAGRGLDSAIGEIMHRDFAFLTRPIDVQRIKELRSHSISLIPILDSDRHIVDIVDLTKTALPSPLTPCSWLAEKANASAPLPSPLPSHCSK